MSHNLPNEKDKESISRSWIRFETKGAHLIIDGVELEDSGTYSCIATNGFGSQTADIVLVVTGRCWILCRFLLHFSKWAGLIYTTCVVCVCVSLFTLLSPRSSSGIVVDNWTNARLVGNIQRLIDRGIEFHWGDAPSAETSARHSRQFSRHPVRRRRIPSSGSHLAQGKFSTKLFFRSLLSLVFLIFDRRSYFFLINSMPCPLNISKKKDF